MIKVVICATSHPSGATNVPAELMAEGLRLGGHEAFIFILDEKANIKDFVKFIKNNSIDFVLSLNPGVLRLRYRLIPLHHFISVPICLFLLDNPAYHLKELAEVLGKSRAGVSVLAPDMNQVETLKNFVERSRFKGATVSYFPWAGPAPSIQAGNANLDYDCVVFCTLDQQITDAGETDTALARISEKFHNDQVADSLRRMFYTDYTIPVSHLVTSLTKKEFTLSDVRQVEIWKQLDSLLKRERRRAMARVLIEVAREKKLKIAVCGSGWDKLGTLPDSMTVIGNVNYRRQFDIFPNSRFLINMDPNWTHGIHDRVFNSMSVGCAVITNENDFILNNFAVGTEILIYKNVSELKKLLTHTNSKQIAAKALVKFKKAHTWQARMRSITEFATQLI